MIKSLHHRSPNLGRVSTEAASERPAPQTDSAQTAEVWCFKKPFDSQEQSERFHVLLADG